MQPTKLSHLLLSTQNRANLQELLVIGAAGSVRWRGKLYFMLVGFYVTLKNTSASPSVFHYKILIFCGKGGINVGQRHPYRTKAA